MKAGIISDTHGNTQMIRLALAAAGPVDWWLHAGDYSQDAAWLAKNSLIPVKTVAGNCDGRVSTPIDEYIDIGGKSIWLTHGHRYGVKYGLEELVEWGEQYGVDVVVFGHTHIPYCQWHGDMLVINPGSLALSRVGRPTYGLLEVLPSGKVTGEIREL